MSHVIIKNEELLVQDQLKNRDQELVFLERNKEKDWSIYKKF